MDISFAIKTIDHVLQYNCFDFYKRSCGQGYHICIYIYIYIIDSITMFVPLSAAFHIALVYTACIQLETHTKALTCYACKWDKSYNCFSCTPAGIVCEAHARSEGTPYSALPWAHNRSSKRRQADRCVSRFVRNMGNCDAIRDTHESKEACTAHDHNAFYASTLRSFLHGR